MLERDGLAAPEGDVGRDDDFGTGSRDPAVECRCTEPAEDHAVDSPDAGAGKHRYDLLRDHRHVNADPVAFPDPEFLEAVRNPHHLAVELAVGVDPLGVVLTSPDERNLVAPGVLHVAIETVVGDVHLAAGEPAGVRVIPLLHFAVGGEPVELPCNSVPELFRVPREILVCRCIVTDPAVLAVGRVGRIVLLGKSYIKVFGHAKPRFTIIHDE